MEASRKGSWVEILFVQDDDLIARRGRNVSRQYRREGLRERWWGNTRCHRTRSMIVLDEVLQSCSQSRVSRISSRVYLVQSCQNSRCLRRGARRQLLQESEGILVIIMLRFDI